MKQLNLIVQKHAGGSLAHPAASKGVGVGQGDTSEQALRHVQSALQFHLETFGPEAPDTDEPVLEAFVAKATI